MEETSESCVKSDLQLSTSPVGVFNDDRSDTRSVGSGLDNSCNHRHSNVQCICMHNSV